MAWFEANRRNYAWREPGVSPWGRLVAEMLLRQTAARNVEAVWSCLMRQYQEPMDLMDAKPEQLGSVIQPLGLVSQRREALQDAARHIVQRHGGLVPSSTGELLAIPHVGPYTAHAVQLFSFGIPAALVDVNVLRIMDRCFGLKTRTRSPHREKQVWTLAKRLIPEEKTADFFLALLDLAAQVCTATKPRCKGCPLRPNCGVGKQPR